MANEEDKMNRDWEFDINMAGISAPTGKGSVELPEGFYEVNMHDIYINPEKSERVIIKVMISEGPFKGVIRTTGLGKPKSAEDKVRYYWRALAESSGYTPSQLDSGAVRLSPSAFKGRKAFIRYTPRPDEKSYEQIDFLAPTEWTSQKTMFTQGAVTSTASNTATSTGGKPPASKGDLLAKLGVQ